MRCGDDHAQPGGAPRVIAAASAILFRDGDVLLVRRATGRHAGLWSAPGGRIEPGETAVAAAERELREETGLASTGLVAFANRDVPGEDAPGNGTGGNSVYRIVVHAGLAGPGEPRAASDAAEARFFSRSDLVRLPATPDLRPLVELAFHVLRGCAP